MAERIVYRSGVGRICPDCGWPAAQCQCSSRRSDAPVPDKVTAKLRLEKKGRGGKSVTVIDGLPDNAAFLDELAGALKRSCGTGGTVRPGAVELAGDVRERVRTLARGTFAAGERTLTWDGLDDRGAAVSPAVYHVRLLSHGETASQKVIWLGN